MKIKLNLDRLNCIMGEFNNIIENSNLFHEVEL